MDDGRIAAPSSLPLASRKMDRHSVERVNELDSGKVNSSGKEESLLEAEIEAKKAETNLLKIEAQLKKMKENQIGQTLSL